MSGQLRYFYDFLSQPSRALFIALKMSETPFEDCSVALRKAEHLTEEFRTKVNRFQKVPCIVDKDGFQLSESIAILRYLSKDGRISEKLYPSEIKVRARVDEYLEWQHHNTRANLALYFLNKMIYPLMGLTIHPKKIEKLEDNMEKTLTEFEDIWLNSNSKFLAGDSLTVADIWAACEIEQPKAAGYDTEKNHQKLKSYMSSVRNETSPYYNEAHEILFKLAKKAGIQMK